MSIQINGTTGISGVDGTAGSPALQGADTNTGISFGTDEVAINTGGTERAKVDSSGRVLVGTSSASSAREVIIAQGNTVASTTSGEIALRRGSLPSGADQYLGVVSFDDNSGNTGAEIVCASTGSWTSGSDHRSRLVFLTTADGASSPTERGRFTSSGSFLVGTSDTSPGSGEGIKLRFNPTDKNATQISAVIDTPTGSTSHFHLYNLNATNNGYRFYVKSDGGIANYSANNSNLSDINSKKDISPAADTWNCLKQWEIVNYRYKDQPDDADLNLGVIAQQVAESCPEVITVFQAATEDEPEKLGVKEQQMYWMAIKALQEAQVRIETLEAKVAALEGGAV